MFLLEYATELMQLAFGAGFIILIIFTVRPLIRLHRLLSKVDHLADKVENLTDLFETYIRKPAEIMSKLISFAAPLLLRGSRK